MASATKKKSTTKKKTTKKTARNTAKNTTKAAAKKPARRTSGNSGKTGKRSAKKPETRCPIRREVGSIVMLALTLCTIVSYFGVHAIFINWLVKLLRGLLGYGYFLAAPAMLLASLILWFHGGRPVALRVTCTAMLPVLFGCLGQLLVSKESLALSIWMFDPLWNSGLAGRSGGALSGALAILSKTLFSKIVSVILFLILFVIFLMGALHLTVADLIAHHRNRPVYEEKEPAPMRRSTPAIPRTKPSFDAGHRPQIDFPLDQEKPPVSPDSPAAQQVPDSEPLAWSAERAKREPGRFTSFFRHKSDKQRTPAQVLTESMHQPEPTEEPPMEPPASAVPTEDLPVNAPTGPVRPISPQPVIRDTSHGVSAAVQTPAMSSAPASVTAEPNLEPFLKPKKAQTAREVAAQTAAVTEEIENKLAEDEEVYQFPPVTLLNESKLDNHMEAGAELRNNARRLAETLTSFGVDATPGDVVHGPSVTRYEFVLDQGVKLSKITNLADDIALALGATGVRIAPIPDKISVVGIEVPNKHVTPVLIRDVIDSQEFRAHKSNVAFALGRDIAGRNVIGNIEKLPHVLIAGTTGSGKSVCTNSLIVSLLYRSTPEQVRFIMVDPKMVELAPYNGIPHLLIPVVTDPKKAAGALQWAVFEMMKRYKTFSECGVKKLEEYNKFARASEDRETLPAVVVVIDELADLMLVAAKEVEESICRVAQMGRAAGVHLVIATQRPSADVITGLMKANIPSRIAFAVASSLESRIILDTQGAEKLVGKGDMLYAPLGVGKPTRVQGCFISPEEIDRVVQFVKTTGEANYSEEVLNKIEETMQERDNKGGRGASTADSASEEDVLFPNAVEVVLETGQASVSMLQRRLKLGYSRAARLVDQMEDHGIVGPFEGSKPRQLLITRAQWQEMQMGGNPEEVSGGEEEM